MERVRITKPNPNAEDLNTLPYPPTEEEWEEIEHNLQLNEGNAPMVEEQNTSTW